MLYRSPDHVAQVLLPEEWNCSRKDVGWGWGWLHCVALAAPRAPTLETRGPLMSVDGPVPLLQCEKRLHARASSKMKRREKKPWL